ncbi:MAG: metallophosphoesterase, partial [Selenomonadaceae bacterium]
IKLLCNSNQLVADGTRPLYLAGADYPIVKEQFDSLKDLYTEKAMADLPDNAVKVLLAHHPDFIDNGAEYGAELVLTGHTHGCQIGIMGIPLVPGGFKYRRGMYQVGTTMGYVHSGNGSWFPIRIGCPPEIAVFTLRA